MGSENHSANLRFASFRDDRSFSSGGLEQAVDDTTSIKSMLLEEEAVADKILIKGKFDTKIYFEADGGTTYCSLYKTFNDPCVFSSIPDWCTLDCGSTTITVKCLKNKEMSARSVTIYFYRKRNSSALAELTITQNGNVSNRITQDASANHKQSSNPVSTTSLANVPHNVDTVLKTTDSKTSSYPIVVNVPSNCIYTDVHKWEVVSVEIREDCSVLHKRVIPSSSSSWINSTRNEYIEDEQTGKRYYLVTSSLSISPQKTFLKSAAPYDFTEVYGVLPESVKYINISSGSKYYVKALKIR